jgi:anti-sigma factor RsiW
MDCQRDPETIAAYVDDELAPAERAELETHLASCTGCRELVRAQRRLGELFASLPAAEPPGDFEARFWARVERDAAPSLAARLRALFSPRVLSLAIGAAAIALFLVLPRAGNPPASNSVPAPDVPIVANSEDFQLVQDPDMDAISEVDVLEDWDDASPS